MKEMIENEGVEKKMMTMSNTLTQCSATYQPNLHSMRTLTETSKQAGNTNVCTADD